MSDSNFAAIVALGVLGIVGLFFYHIGHERIEAGFKAVGKVFAIVLLVLVGIALAGAAIYGLVSGYESLSVKGVLFLIFCTLLILIFKDKK